MPRPVATPTRAARPPTRRAKPGLSPLERGVIDHFAPWGEVLGVPPSVAQIYGLLYAAEEPMAFDDIREKLGKSLGSVSQGLKFLRDRELVTVEREPAARRERYAAVPSLGRFVQAQLKGEVLPRLEAGAKNLPRLRELAAAVDGECAARIERLAGWNQRGRELLPMMLDLMGG